MLIDTHSHIYHQYYNNSIDDLINAANNRGIMKIISVGVDLKSSEECIKLAEKYPNIYATCGYHPHEAMKVPKRYLYELEQFIKHPKVVALGEIGLDYYYNFSKPITQQRIFKEQLEMALDIKIPVVIHSRESDDDIYNSIIETNNYNGVIHCFSSDLDFANKIIDHGFHLSFTGMVTFMDALEEVIKKIDLNKIMLETDSPYLAPKPYRGKQNQPAYLYEIAEKIAQIKNIDIEEVAQITTKNALSLFKKLSN